MKPVSVNYHFSRKCNYSCSFCFHTGKSSFRLSLEEAIKGLALLVEAGMKKINFSGGEPFLYADNYLGPLILYAKSQLHVECVSVVSNGSIIEPGWFEKYGRYLDILAISCDSFDDTANARIGRRSGDYFSRLRKTSTLCRQYGIRFKMNTVVNVYNWREDMNDKIKALDPFRWKCFQVLILHGENGGSKTDIRNARSYAVTEEQYRHFIAVHQDRKCLISEPAELMKDSYLILDEHMRFLNCLASDKTPSASILEAGVGNAMRDSGFNCRLFRERGGIYQWGEQHD